MAEQGYNFSDDPSAIEDMRRLEITIWAEEEVLDISENLAETIDDAGVYITLDVKDLEVYR